MRFLPLFLLVLGGGCSSLFRAPVEPPRSENVICVIHPRMCGLSVDAPVLVRPTRVDLGGV